MKKGISGSDKYIPKWEIGMKVASVTQKGCGTAHVSFQNKCILEIVPMYAAEGIKGLDAIFLKDEHGRNIFTYTPPRHLNGVNYQATLKVENGKDERQFELYLLAALRIENGPSIIAEIQPHLQHLQRHATAVTC